VTKGELLYSCLLQVKPMQFSESGSEGGTIPKEPRTPWTDLTERSQWTREDWERIAAMFECVGEPSGEKLYECVLKVTPNQRREQTGVEVPRPQWKDMHWMPFGLPTRAERWSEIARLFVQRLREVV
jgi:hypothetical protein